MAITRPINHYYEDAEAGQDLHSPFLAAGQKHSLAKPPPNVQSCEYILKCVFLTEAYIRIKSKWASKHFRQF